MSDGRIAVVFVDQAVSKDGDALLVEGERPVPPRTRVERFELAASDHVPGCLCCRARSPAASALSRLFLAHATRPREPLWRVLVLATPEGRQAVLAALEQDVLLRARFGLRPGG